MAAERQLRLTKPLERAVRDGHPWVYRSALEGSAAPGTVVTLLDRRHRFLARGVTDEGPIGLRVWTTRDEPLDVGLVRTRVQRAKALRKALPLGDTTAWRLLHGEGDGTPGVVVDRYGTEDGVFAVIRLDGSVAKLGWLIETVAASVEADGVLVKRRRGAPVEYLRGLRPPEPAAIRERGMILLADLRRGQKTGLFLDHRESRARVRALAPGRRVLNLYGYTGGFSVAAGLGGATRVLTVDVAAPAVAMAQATWEANGLPDVHHGVAEDAPTFLAQNDQRWDLVVADPPSFAPNERSKPAALESYAKLHAACLTRLARGGLYLAASCSSHVSAEDFLATLRAGARRARVTLQVLEQNGAPADHPRLVSFPEGDYLKVVLARPC